MQDRSHQLLVVTVGFLALSWVAVSLRCFVRLHLVKAFGIDDYLIVVSQLVFTILCGTLVAGAHYGIGRHNIDLTPYAISEALKYQTLSELFYVADTAIIKLSVGFLLMRITPNSVKIYRNIIITSMVIMSLWTFITFFIILFQCRPVSFAWDKSSGKGKCVAGSTIANTGYAFSAMDILFDWMFALIPVPMLWDVKMSIQVKSSLFLILGLGVFASTATIVRLKYLVALTNPENILYTFSIALIWTCIEVGLGITAASIATLRPLFKRFKLRGFTNSGSGSQRQTTHEGYAFDLGYARSGDAMPKIRSTTHARALSDGNTSQESILEHGHAKGGGISKRTEVEIQYENRSGHGSEHEPRASSS